MKYVRVANFDRYQHYGRRYKRVSWVKFHAAFLRDLKLRNLPITSRFLAALLLLVAGERGNVFPSNPAWIAEEVGLPTAAVKRGVTDLRRIGFLEPATEAALEAALGATLEEGLDIEGEKEKEPPSGEPIGSPSVGADAGEFVAWFVDTSTAAGRVPPRQVIGQVASQVAALLGDGFTGPQVQAGLQLLIDKGKHPSILPSLVYEAQATPRNSSRYGRGITTEHTKRAVVAEIEREFGRKELPT